jgi:hypothetical protein
MLETVGVVVAILIGVGNFFYLIFKDKGKDVWNLSDRLNKLDQSRAEFREAVLKQVNITYDESVTRFGEAMKAQIEHVRLLELELYKNFVRIDTFRDALSSHNTSINERLNRFEKRFDTIETLLREMH